MKNKVNWDSLTDTQFENMMQNIIKENDYFLYPQDRNNLLQYKHKSWRSSIVKHFRNVEVNCPILDIVKSIIDIDRLNLISNDKIILHKNTKTLKDSKLDRGSLWHISHEMGNIGCYSRDSNIINIFLFNFYNTKTMWIDVIFAILHELQHKYQRVVLNDMSDGIPAWMNEEYENSKSEKDANEYAKNIMLENKDKINSMLNVNFDWYFYNYDIVDDKIKENIIKTENYTKLLNDKMGIKINKLKEEITNG